MDLITLDLISLAVISLELIYQDLISLDLISLVLISLPYSLGESDQLLQFGIYKTATKPSVWW